MKTFVLFVVTVMNIKFISCFLSYPFVADQLLQPFLESLEGINEEIDKDLMSRAIAGEKCMRECRKNDRKVCHFNFTLKHYQVLGA